jgi:long-chain acyl-CoA synthetase
MASEIRFAEGTLPALFSETAARLGERPALRFHAHGLWRNLSWRGWRDAAFHVAADLVEAGVEHGDRVVLWAGTRVEWAICDLAIALAGAVSVPIYPTVTGAQAHELLAHSGARALIAEAPTNLARLFAADGKKLAAGLARVVVLEDRAIGVVKPEEGPREHDLSTLGLTAAQKKKVRTYGELVHRAVAPGSETWWPARAAVLRPDDLASIVYTSGTTGASKGACLSHANFLFEIDRLAEIAAVDERDEQLLFLPLAHIFGKQVLTLQYRAGFTTTFARSLLQALDDALEVEPTFLASVPRLFEKVQSACMSEARQRGRRSEALFEWGTAVGRRWARARAAGDRPTSLARGEIDWARKIVLEKVKRRFGRRLRLAVSGGAPLGADLTEWLWGAGVPVLEAYGMTEAGGGVTINRPNDYRFGSVGKPLEGVEVRLADDGEILVRGPNVMRGYWRDPEATAQLIDAEGWLHTGDIGRIDERGFLFVTDRKKDLIVTAGGKNVAPQRVEALLEAGEAVSFAVVVGDGRPHCVALLRPSAALFARVRARLGAAASFEAIAADREVREDLQAAVDAANRSLAPFETVKRFALLPEEPSAESGTLTPTLKLRRRILIERHRELIDSLYAPETTR